MKIVCQSVLLLFLTCCFILFRDLIFSPTSPAYRYVWAQILCFLGQQILTYSYPFLCSSPQSDFAAVQVCKLALLSYQRREGFSHLCVKHFICLPLFFPIYSVLPVQLTGSYQRSMVMSFNCIASVAHEHPSYSSARQVRLTGLFNRMLQALIAKMFSFSLIHAHRLFFALLSSPTSPAYRFVAKSMPTCLMFRCHLCLLKFRCFLLLPCSVQLVRLTGTYMNLDPFLFIHNPHHSHPTLRYV